MLVSRCSLAAVLSLSLAVGCNTPGHVRAVKTADRMDELRSSIEELQSRTTATATTLAEVLASKDQNPEPAFQALESAVHELEGARRRTEGRLSALRGEADRYFVSWKEQAATITDKDLKEKSEERCAKLTSAVDRVERSLAPAFEAIESHMASFRDTVKYLSIDLTASSIGSIEGRSKDASKSAKSIHSKLNEALEIVNEVAPLFTRAQASAPRPSTGTDTSSNEN